jgi:Ser/Thr protein kinase RdoA (MazF antagonist)
MENPPADRQKNSQKNEFYFRLTPDVVMNAMENAGLFPAGHCRALNSLENRVFEIGLDDGSIVVAKFYRPARWSATQILEEHEFLFDLVENEVPALAPIVFSQGGSLKEIEGIYYAVWPLTGGREPAEFSDEELEITGRLLARIHNVGASRNAANRPLLSAQRLGVDSLEFLLAHDFIPTELKNDYDYAVRKTVEVYEKLSEGVAVHRIHGDCHIGNLLYGSLGWYFLDFDDFCVGPAVQDIWLIASGRDQHALLRQKIFLDAYRTFRDFDDAWLNLVEPLRSLRYIHYSAWIARRWNDPAFPPAFPHFGTPDYWLTELNDLKEQLHIFQQREPKYFIMEKIPDEKEELTNKDFFWDM